MMKNCHQRAKSAVAAAVVAAEVIDALRLLPHAEIFPTNST